MPRSILLKKGMEISAFSAKSAWESPLLARKILIFLPRVFFMACPSLPHSPQSRAWDQAENRKHTIKAIMLATLSVC
jgi:hypothetical protein